jgi:mono/diheme cytochrome c family protein
MRPAAGVVATLLLALPAAAQDMDEAVAAGEMVFHAGGCTSCHTIQNGAFLAGGAAIETPFGKFYAPNITQDPETGIGSWSFEDFDRAMREGVAPDGSPYYPSFPYTSYTRMLDSDLRALWAYLQSVEPVRQDRREHELRLPYNVRTALWPWRWLHFSPARFEPDPGRSADWNRGAYLVQALGHCGECHTPRGVTGAVDAGRFLAGNPDGPEGERIPNITPDPETGIGRWSESDVVFFLQIGMMPDGDFAGGSMAPVIRNSTGKLAAEDRSAIAAYLLSLEPVRNGLGR